MGETIWVLLIFDISNASTVEAQNVPLGCLGSQLGRCRKVR